jgi:hypothetical protein
VLLKVLLALPALKALPVLTVHKALLALKV